MKRKPPRGSRLRTEQWLEQIRQEATVCERAGRRYTAAMLREAAKDIAGLHETRASFGALRHEMDEIVTILRARVDAGDELAAFIDDIPASAVPACWLDELRARVAAFRGDTEPPDTEGATS